MSVLKAVIGYHCYRVPVSSAAVLPAQPAGRLLPEGGDILDRADVPQAVPTVAASSPVESHCGSLTWRPAGDVQGGRGGQPRPRPPGRDWGPRPPGG